MSAARPQTTPVPTVEEFLKLQSDEYGAWVAVVPITHDGSLAYMPGHAVPKSNVELYGYDKDGLVAKADSKAAEAVVTSLSKDV